jgi:hypothetical protein
MTILPLFRKTVSNVVKGDGKVFIATRKDANTYGLFILSLDVRYNPAADHEPQGTVRMKVDLSDCLKATFISTHIALIYSGKNQRPVVYLTGSCVAATDDAPPGLRYWIKLSYGAFDNTTPEEVGFVIHDFKGNRVAYGSGPLSSGQIAVLPKSDFFQSESTPRPKGNRITLI